MSRFEISRIISSFWINNSCDKLHKYFDPIMRILFGLKPPDSRCSMSADLQYKQQRECLKGLRAKFWPKIHFDVVVSLCLLRFHFIFGRHFYTSHIQHTVHNIDSEVVLKMKKKSLNWNDFLVKNFAYSSPVHFIFSCYPQLAELDL